MATTKWLDPSGWTMADWEDATKRPYFNFLWDALKGAADERVAFVEESHDSGFSTNYIFPDYVTDNSVALAADYLKIKNGVFPIGVNTLLLMNNNDMSDGGTVTSNIDVPESLQLSDLLDELGYTGDTKMLHDEDTNSGARPALARMAWVVQWFEIMNYMTWFNSLTAKNGSSGNTSNWVSDLEFQFYQLDCFYNYDPNSSTFIAANCYERQPRTTSSDVDIYTAGDLAESSPFDDAQAVRDYVISKFNPDGGSWVSSNTLINIRVGAVQEESIQNEVLANNFTILCILKQQRMRFKLNDAFRATSPNRYTPDIYWFLYYNEDSITGLGSYTFSDFGEGFSIDENSLVKLTADGSGWYYLTPDPDFDHEPVLSVPAVGNANNQDFCCRKRSLTPNETYNADINSFYLKPNLTDGSNFEYYTPAP
jgi:hypothetical protein